MKAEQLFITPNRLWWSLLYRI